MNRRTFFDAVRSAPFGGGLSQPQVDGMSKILDEWDRRGLTDSRWLAYILASVFHETAKKFQPISEMGGEAYLQSKPYYPWYGRGLIQITWQTNYSKFGITSAADALSWPVALRVLFDGMINGKFTGSALSHWFSATVDDPVNARRIVNVMDRADLIAGYHRAFLAAIKAALAAAPAVPLSPPVPAPVHIDNLPGAKPAPPGWWAWLLGRKA